MSGTKFGGLTPQGLHTNCTRKWERRLKTFIDFSNYESGFMNPLKNEEISLLKT